MKEDLLNYSSRNTSSNTNSNQEATSEAVVLRRNQQKEEVDLELENVKTKLAEHVKTIENQQREIENVKNALLKKTIEQEATLSELSLAKELIAKKELELNQIKENVSKEDSELKSDLRKEKERNAEIMDLLSKEREQNRTINQELSVLKETLLSSLNMEKQLESFIDQETAKSKKLEKQLTYLLSKFNDERQRVYINLLEIRGHSEDFLQYCEEHCKSLSEATTAKNT